MWIIWGDKIIQRFKFCLLQNIVPERIDKFVTHSLLSALCSLVTQYFWKSYSLSHKHHIHTSTHTWKSKSKSNIDRQQWQLKTAEKEMFDEGMEAITKINVQQTGQCRKCAKISGFTDDISRSMQICKPCIQKLYRDGVPPKKVLQALFVYYKQY